LAQENDFVSEALLDWISGLTAEYGFDGYRLDTARHVPKSFLSDLTEAANAYLIGNAMQVLTVNATSNVGEVAAEEWRTQYTASYQDVMDGVLNFPFYYG